MSPKKLLILVLLAAGVAGSGVRVLLPGESLEGTVRIVVEVPA